jgi:transposase
MRRPTLESAPTAPNAAESEFDWYVGIDGGGATHQVCVLDAAGRAVGERAVAHAGADLAALAAWLHEVAGPSLARVAVGLESRHAGPVALCLEHGAAVFAINPKQLERFRERASAAGAKDDRRDAYVAASALRTDRGAFHRVVPDDARVVALRELSRTADELREDTRRLSNRLRAQLERYFPQMLTLAPGADEPWLWTLLEWVPTPAAAARVREAAVARVLKAHRIRRLGAPEVLAALRAPALVVAPGTVEAVSAHVALLVPQLQLVSEHHRRCLVQLEAAVAALAGPGGDPPSGPAPNAPPDASSPSPDALGTAVRLVRSLPGVGGVIAGALVAEAAGALLAGDYHALRTHGGTAPVTKQSGKQRLVAMRYACNQRLRTALYHWARVSTQHDAAARQYYATLRRRGHSHPRALRSVADRWLRILTSMLATGTPYDRTRFASCVATP